MWPEFVRPSQPPSAAKVVTTPKACSLSATADSVSGPCREINAPPRAGGVTGVQRLRTAANRLEAVLQQDAKRQRREETAREAEVGSSDEETWCIRREIWGKQITAARAKVQAAEEELDAALTGEEAGVPSASQASECPQLEHYAADQEMEDEAVRDNVVTITGAAEAAAMRLEQLISVETSRAARAALEHDTADGGREERAVERSRKRIRTARQEALAAAELVEQVARFDLEAELEALLDEESAMPPKPQEVGTPTANAKKCAAMVAALAGLLRCSPQGRYYSGAGCGILLELAEPELEELGLRTRGADAAPGWAQNGATEVEREGHTAIQDELAADEATFAADTEMDDWFAEEGLTTAAAEEAEGREEEEAPTLDHATAVPADGSSSTSQKVSGCPPLEEAEAYARPAEDTAETAEEVKPRPAAGFALLAEDVEEAGRRKEVAEEGGGGTRNARDGGTSANDFAEDLAVEAGGGGFGGGGTGQLECLEAGGPDTRADRASPLQTRLEEECGACKNQDALPTPGRTGDKASDLTQSRNRDDIAEEEACESTLTQPPTPLPKKRRKEACESSEFAPLEPDAALPMSSSPDVAIGSSNVGERLGRSNAAENLQTSFSNDAGMRRPETELTGPQLKVTKIETQSDTQAGACADGESLAELAGEPASGRRRTQKSAPCLKCNGPCGPTCSTDDLPASNDQCEDAADAFSRAVQRHLANKQEARKEETTNGSAEASSGRKRPRAGKEANHDGRTKAARSTKAVELSFGQPPAWFLAAPVLGNVRLHPTHLCHIAWHRGLVWCWRCGCFATAVLNDLKKECTGPTTAGTRQLKRLRLGQTPINTVDWPLAEHTARNLAA